MTISGHPPLISIVLPTHNGARFLAAAIRSCLVQTHRELELIIVDDASTDGTPALVAEFARLDPRIRVLTNERNCQLPASLNRGFADARGRYLTWISDDNVFGSHALATLLDELEKHPEAGIVYSSYYFINEHDKRLGRFGGVPEELLFVCVVGACFLYKREVHETLGGFDGAKFRMEDLDFWLRAAAHYRFRYIDRPELYSYRKHSRSLSHAISSREEIYDRYREDHIHSFERFLNDTLGAELSAGQLDLHVQLYLEEIIKTDRRDFDLAGRLVSYLHYLERLEKIDWSRIGFDPDRAGRVIRQKRDRILELVVNGLVFDNKTLAGKNPRLASHLHKPIFWYYREYEVLPLWFKRIGHIIKTIQGNKPIRSRTS